MERITSATIFKAFDGAIFESEIECKEYEEKRRNFLVKVRFYQVNHSPDLTETGMFTKSLFVAVYSTYGLHQEIVKNYCIKKFGYLGESVQGFRFQPHFIVSSIDFKTYSSGVIESFGDKRCHDKILLSPEELDEFKGIKRFDYMKEWGFR